MAAPEQKMRVVFMGTPDFAATVLRHVAAWPGCEVVAAYCQPDRPAGRGHKLQPPAVKVLAQELGIPVFQPLNFKDEADRAALAGLRPDALVVAAYGLILPQSVLDIPTIGPFNVHGSLLPQYRGAAPINWAILDGEAETGVSIMYMAKELDAGDVILQKTTPIGEQEDAQTLTARLAELGAQALSEAVEALRNGTAGRTPQDASQQTYASMLSRDMSPIDWNRTARQINCQVRGLIPWPCATAELAGQRFKIYETVLGRETDSAPGTILSAGKQGIEVACGDGRSLYLTQLQAEGGKRMAAAAYLLGHPMEISSN